MKKMMKTAIPALAALLGLLSHPHPADAISGGFCFGGVCASGAAEVKKLGDKLQALRAQKKNELQLATDCGMSGIWIFNPNPELVGYCLPSDPSRNQVQDCTINQHGTWIYGSFSSYPALDIAMLSEGMPERDRFGGLGGRCWVPNISTPYTPPPNPALGNCAAGSQASICEPSGVIPVCDVIGGCTVHTVPTDPCTPGETSLGCGCDSDGTCTEP